MSTRDDALALVTAERDRQGQLWGGEHAWGSGDCSSPNVPEPVKAAVLAEECGEVSRAMLDGDPRALLAELTQVAAVAVAWMEYLIGLGVSDGA